MLHPDGSGEVDFDEFVLTMRTQATGGGGLADVAGAAGAFFNLFANPFSWIGGGTAAAAAHANKQDAVRV